MTDEGSAHESRKDIVDSVAGRAKEVFGAVTGKDDLAEEGRLQQAEVKARRDAEAVETAATVQADAAEQNLREVRHQADEARQTVEDVTDANEAAVQNDRLENQRVAEHEAMAAADAGRIEAEQKSANAKANAVADRHDEELSAAEEVSAAREAYEDTLTEADRLEKEAAAARRKAEEESK